MEAQVTQPSLADVLSELDRAVGRDRPIAEQVSNVAEVLTRALSEPSWLPACCLAKDLDVDYARHRVFRDPDGRFVVVAMVWAPGQATPVHDHGGVWCVEGVYQGCIGVTRYDMQSFRRKIAWFKPHERLDQDLGCTGSLIPPVEYHTIANITEETAITVHVYGSELTECRVFEPRDDGSYLECYKPLGYSSVLEA